jgi:hypothetical protein
MFRRIIPAMTAVMLATQPGQAQIAASLAITKKQHLAGEPVIAVVTITNHSGRDLVLQSDGRFQWLDFIVKSSNGAPVNARNRVLFGPMKIGTGQTMAREVDLARHFHLTEPGNFSASAVIQPAADPSAGTSTNRVFFNLSPGRPYWAQKVGLSAKPGKTREFRVINFSGDSKSQLYAQIADDATGQLVTTFLLGDVLMFRKPAVAVDRQQRMHVLFLATPAMYVHYVITTDGKVISRQIHQRGPHGDPLLLTLGDGSVQVGNSIPYDPKAAAEQRAKVRKASDRPAITY